jgi:hypothetical protein
VRRGPHVEWSGSVIFIGAATRVCFVGGRRGGGSTTMCEQLKDDGPVEDEFKLSLWLATSRNFWRDTTLVMTAQVTAAYF